MKTQTLFKQKILVTLIASALGVTATNAHAAECNIQGTAASANGATLVTTGPLNPIDGFPEFVTDSNEVAVQRCTDAAFCFFDPIVQTDPFSRQIGTGGEAFYWSAAAVVSDTAGNDILNLEFAAETAFLQAGPNGEPINGSQFPFLRMRFVMGVPVDGIYTVKHPYGTDTFTVVGATGARDVFSTIDRGFAANDSVQGTVGPFLKSVNSPKGYLGDNTPDLVTGSPCKTPVLDGSGMPVTINNNPVVEPWNYVEVSGIDTSGAAVVFGGGATVLRTDNFSVQGKLYDGQVQTPITSNRLSYSRSIGGPAQIDTFATSSKTATVTATDGPTNPVGSATIGEPLTLDRSAINLNDAVNSLSIPVATASAAKLPSIVQLSASDTGSDTTTLNVNLVDFVDIAQADYDLATNFLSVTATSSDKRLSPKLTLRDFGDFTAATPTKLVDTKAPPALVHVDSAAGGTAVAQVRVIEAAAPNAPSNLALVPNTATSKTLTLQWSDNSTNEQDFKVYLVAAGARTVVATVAANTRQATISNLSADTLYTFQVEAYNLVTSSSSTPLQAKTLALPVAPTGVAASLSTTVSRGINVSWVDNSSDETGFVISRSTTSGGTYVKVNNAPAGAQTAVDSSAQTGATYFYKVAAVRGDDSSDSVASASIATPTAVPTSAGRPTFTAASTTSSSVKVNWTDRSNNETGFQVYRSTIDTGGFVAVSAVLSAGTVTYTDTTVAAGTRYYYRVDVSGWAGVVPSAVSLSVSTPALVLSAPRGLAASNASQPVLSWQDTNTFETGYRVSARPITFNDLGVATINTALTNLTPNPLAPDSIGYTEARALTANALYQYSVSGLNGATVGTAATVYAIPGGIPTPTNLTATRPTIGSAAAQSVVTLSWTALTAPAVGGYKVERCTVTGTQDCNGSTGWVAATTTPGTIAGRTRATATSTVAATRGITYRFRLIATTGTVVTGINSAPSAIASVTR